MDQFLKQQDALAQRINTQALVLYQKLQSLSTDQLQLSDHWRQYFNHKHAGRLFFSIQTGAELLYRSIQLKGGRPEALTLMDYGAGVGNLFMLAKLIGVRCVVYNDYDADAALAGKNLCDALEIPVDLYITGDHSATFQALKEKNISCDIILSRNVVEHIYDLQDFYQQARLLQPEALIYFSTTANYHNFANRWLHYRIHQQHELTFLKKREELIRVAYPEADASEVFKLAKASRGLALGDFTQAMETFFSSGRLPNPTIHRTNTVDPETGVWAEHLIRKQDYKWIIEPLGYEVNIIPAFWDTHYRKWHKRLLGKLMNALTRLLGDEKGLWVTSFIYIIARPTDAGAHTRGGA